VLGLQVLGNFHFYDYNTPVGFDEELLGSFDLIIADPPYLVGSDVHFLLLAPFTHEAF
jgi:methylase of polypeptide subunit release factors